MWDPELWQSAREGQQQRPLATDPTPGHSSPKAFNLVLNALPGVPEDSKLAKMSIPGHANLAEYKRAVPKVAPIGDQIGEQIGEQNSPGFLKNIFSIY